MYYLPQTVKNALNESIRERGEKIRFEKQEIARTEVKLSLNYAALLVLEQGEDGLTFESLLESYQKHFDCPEEDVREEIEEATRKGWIYPLYSNPLENNQEYHVTKRLWKELDYI